MIKGTDNIHEALEKVAITKKLVDPVRERALHRAAELFRTDGIPREVAVANLARVRAKLNSIATMAERRSAAAESKMLQAAQGGRTTHAIPEYIRGGGARDMQTIQQQAALNTRMQGISRPAREAIEETRGVPGRHQNLPWGDRQVKPAYQPRPGETVWKRQQPTEGHGTGRLMGRGKHTRPVTTTDPRTGQKTTKWVYVGDPNKFHGAVNLEFPMKDWYGKQMVRDYIKQNRTAQGLDLKTGLDPKKAEAIRRARRQRLLERQASNRGLPPGHTGRVPPSLRANTGTGVAPALVAK